MKQVNFKIANAIGESVVTNPLSSAINKTPFRRLFASLSDIIDNTSVAVNFYLAAVAYNHNFRYTVYKISSCN